MWSQRKGGLSAITQVHPVRYLLQDGVNTVRYVLSNGVKVFSPEIINIAQGQGVHELEASTAARVNGEYVRGVPGSTSFLRRLVLSKNLTFPRLFRRFSAARISH